MACPRPGLSDAKSRLAVWSACSLLLVHLVGSFTRKRNDWWVGMPNFQVCLNPSDPLCLQGRVGGLCGTQFAGDAGDQEDADLPAPALSNGTRASKLRQFCLLPRAHGGGFYGICVSRRTCVDDLERMWRGGFCMITGFGRVRTRPKADSRTAKRFFPSKRWRIRSRAFPSSGRHRFCT